MSKSDQIEFAPEDPASHGAPARTWKMLYSQNSRT